MALRGREDGSADGDRARERERHVGLGGPHDVEVVGAHVRDHPVRGAYQAELGEALQERLQRHALDHQGLGAGLDGGVDDAHLLDDVGVRGSIDGVLGPVGEDHRRLGARRLGAGDDAARAKAPRDEPRDAALAARAVHVDADRDPLQVAAVTESLDGTQQQEDGEQREQEDELGHAPASAPEPGARAVAGSFSWIPLAGRTRPERLGSSRSLMTRTFYHRPGPGVDVMRRLGGGPEPGPAETDSRGDGGEGGPRFGSPRESNTPPGPSSPATTSASPASRSASSPQAWALLRLLHHRSGRNIACSIAPCGGMTTKSSPRFSGCPAAASRRTIRASEPRCSS